jgi:hypothetical protein
MPTKEGSVICPHCGAKDSLYEWRHESTTITSLRSLLDGITVAIVCPGDTIIDNQGIKCGECRQSVNNLATIWEG